MGIGLISLRGTVLRRFVDAWAPPGRKSYAIGWNWEVFIYMNLVSILISHTRDLIRIY